MRVMFSIKFAPPLRPPPRKPSIILASSRRRRKWRRKKSLGENLFGEKRVKKRRGTKEEGEADCRQGGKGRGKFECRNLSTRVSHIWKFLWLWTLKNGNATRTGSIPTPNINQFISRNFGQNNGLLGLLHIN